MQAASGMLLQLIGFYVFGAEALRDPREPQVPTQVLRTESSLLAVNETGSGNLHLESSGEEEWIRPTDVFFVANPFAAELFPTLKTATYEKFCKHMPGLFSKGPNHPDAQFKCQELVHHPLSTDDQYLSYQSVINFMMAMPKEHAEGIVTRENELALFKFSDHLWRKEEPGTDARKVGIAASPENHRRMRPVVAKLLGNGTTSTWTEQEVNEYAMEFVQKTLETGRFSIDDSTDWVINALHKYHLGFELTKDNFKARDFYDFQQAALKQIVLKGAMGQSYVPVIGTVLEAVMRRNIAEEREKWINHYKENLAEKYDEIISQGGRDKTFFLKGILESIMIGGGLPVPTIIQNLLAVWHSKHSPLPKDSHLREQIIQSPYHQEQFILEVIRRYPPVSSMPWYRKTSESPTPRHTITNIVMALRDPEVFEAPLDFNPTRDVNLLRKTVGVAWGAPTNGEKAWASVQQDPLDWYSLKHTTSDSHGCPGQKLSFVMVKAFFSSWIALTELSKSFDLEVDASSDAVFTDFQADKGTPKLKFKKKVHGRKRRFDEDEEDNNEAGYWRASEGAPPKKRRPGY